MTTDELRDTVLRMLCEIAPEVDPAAIAPDVDSMDFLNFVIAVDQELHVEIAETDYPRLSTLDGFVAYLGERLGVPA